MTAYSVLISIISELTRLGVSKRTYDRFILLIWILLKYFIYNRKVVPFVWIEVLHQSLRKPPVCQTKLTYFRNVCQIDSIIRRKNIQKLELMFMKHYAPNRCLYIKVAKLRTGVGSAEMSHLQNRCLKISG